MKSAELKTFSKEQLKEKLIELKREAMNLRFQLVHGQVTNVGRIREVRKAIARVLTFLNNKF